MQWHGACIQMKQVMTHLIQIHTSSTSIESWHCHHTIALQACCHGWWKFNMHCSTPITLSLQHLMFSGCVVHWLFSSHN